MIQAYLITEGLRLPEHRVRASPERVDPTGIAIRWSQHQCIHRRVYYAPHSNALWHIDGYMALVRWRLVIHGGIDGFSRLITYLQQSCFYSPMSFYTWCKNVWMSFQGSIRYFRTFQATLLSVTIVCILLHNKRDTANWLTRDKELEQLKGSDGEVSSAKYSVYRGEGIIGYLPEAVGFSL